jgi:hypothetical protein
MTCVRLVCAGGGFPIRSRLVGDGSLPEELPPPATSRSSDGGGPDMMRRSNSWRPAGEGTTPPERERWNGPPTPVRTGMAGSRLWGREVARTLPWRTPECAGAGWTSLPSLLRVCQVRLTSRFSLPPPPPPLVLLLLLPVCPQNRRPVEEPAPRRGGRWDETKPGPAAAPGERETWRPSLDERGWRGGERPPGGPLPPGAPPPPRGAAGPGGRWGDEERARSAWGGQRTSMEERDMPRRPPPGMGHDDGKWGDRDAREPRPPPGAWGGGDHHHDGSRHHDGHRGHEREWGGHRRDGPGGGGGSGFNSAWERDPAWMHDGQEGGGSAAGGVPRAAPPPTARAAMTAKDIERERQEMQAQWRAQQASKVRVRVHVRMGLLVCDRRAGAAVPHSA